MDNQTGCKEFINCSFELDLSHHYVVSAVYVELKHTF